MATHQDMTLDWLARSDRDSRLNYIKDVINCSKIDELQSISNMVTNAKKRKMDFPRAHEQHLRRKADPSWIIARNAKRAARAAAPEPGEPAPASAVQKKKVQGWWAEEEIVALDCEMVTLWETKRSKAATVSIVNMKQEVIYSGRVFHKKGTFMDDRKHVEITGFRGNMLENGEKFVKVREKVVDLLDGKRTVTVNGTTDWSSLEIPLATGVKNSFDLHQIFRQSTGNFTKRGEAVYEPISLRRLYKHYFHEDIQEGSHSAEKDAKATMRVFQEIYCPLVENGTLPNDQEYYNTTSIFNNIKKMNEM